MNRLTSVKRVRRTVLAGLVSLCFALSGCVESAGGNGPSKLDEEAVAGTWRGAGGGLAVFSKDGTVELSGVTCEEVFTEGVGEVSLTGTWRVKSPHGGGSPWVSLTFPAGSCGAEGATESGFYAYKGSGDLVIHLSDPDMADKSVDFHKD
ncbi:hypothetical protein [Streptomyces niveus]|uniref:hypothetical protein n=1 Tax=Streptomyces niveus TaxID=193462 RepID=UPI00363A5C44